MGKVFVAIARRLRSLLAIARAAASRKRPAAKATRTARTARSASSNKCVECRDDSQCPKGKKCSANACVAKAAVHEGRSVPDRPGLPGRHVQAVRGRRRVRPRRHVRGGRVPAPKKCAKDEDCADDEDCVNGLCLKRRRRQQRRRRLPAPDGLLRVRRLDDPGERARPPRRQQQLHRRRTRPSRCFVDRPHRYVGHRGVQHRAVRAPRAVGRRLPRAPRHRSREDAGRAQGRDRADRPRRRQGSPRGVQMALKTRCIAPSARRSLSAAASGPRRRAKARRCARTSRRSRAASTPRRRSSTRRSSSSRACSTTRRRSSSATARTSAPTSRSCRGDIRTANGLVAAINNSINELKVAFDKYRKDNDARIDSLEQRRRPDRERQAEREQRRPTICGSSARQAFEAARYNDAIEIYKRLVQTYPDARARRRRAVLPRPGYTNLKDWDNAIGAYQQLEPLTGQESHMIARAAGADALVFVRAGEGELPAGEPARYLPLG